MEFKLPSLPYGFDALEPYIDKMTMEIHHDKHHGGYVEKLNAAIKDIKEVEEMSIEELLKNVIMLPEGTRQAVINNGGGHANHSMFWEIMAPASEQKPEGKLLEVLNSTFGSFENFKNKFSEKSMGLFGSGWVFLITDKNGKISFKRHSFQNSPHMDGSTPLMGLDLWEHAYYLKYQNKRADYIAAWWNVVNWKEIENRYENYL